MELRRILRQDKTPVAESCAIALSMRERLVGLLNHSKLSETEGLLLEPCKQVHTFFMRFAIDAVFLSRDGEIIAIDELKPWRVSRLYFSARKCLELPRGRSRRLGLKVGERLEVT
jgi:uncharacterized protein